MKTGQPDEKGSTDKEACLGIPDKGGVLPAGEQRGPANSGWTEETTKICEIFADIDDDGTWWGKDTTIGSSIEIREWLLDILSPALERVRKDERTKIEKETEGLTWIDATPQTAKMMMEEYAKCPDEKLDARAKLVKQFLLNIIRPARKEGVEKLRLEIEKNEWALVRVHTHSDKEYHANCICCQFDKAEGV